MDYVVIPAREPPAGSVRVPASKSYHQRALLLAALSDGAPSIEAGPGEPGDDVRRLEAALARIGGWHGEAWGRDRDRKTCDLGLGGTGFRFVTAAATLRPEGARTLVRGDRSLLQRPHTALRRALARLGGHVKRRKSGSLRVRGGGIEGGRTLRIRADVSSQYASALLLIAPRIGGLTLELLQRPVSRPYLELTLGVLGSFGIETGAEGLDAPGGCLRVAAGVPRATVYRVEADASCAAPWWTAAVLTGGTLVVEGLPRATRQADARLLPILERVGATVTETASGGIRVEGPEGGIAGLRALGDVDLRDASDLVPLVGVLAAGAPGRARIHGAAHVRFKESDRLRTVADGISTLGGTADVTQTGELVVEGTAPLSGGVVSAAADHRLVLAFGVLGLVVPGVVIRGAEAVSKSYPSFLAELGAFGGEGRGEG